eukprot:181006-Amphidinium_carterae.1
MQARDWWSRIRSRVYRRLSALKVRSHQAEPTLVEEWATWNRNKTAVSHEGIGLLARGPACGWTFAATPPGADAALDLGTEIREEQVIHDWDFEMVIHEQCIETGTQRSVRTYDGWFPKLESDHTGCNNLFCAQLSWCQFARLRAQGRPGHQAKLGHA